MLNPDKYPVDKGNPASVDAKAGLSLEVRFFEQSIFI
jgi:hypothetical protein